MNDSEGWDKGAGVCDFLLPPGTDRMDRQKGSHPDDRVDGVQE